MKKNLLFLLSLLVSSSGLHAQTVTVGTGTSYNSSTAYPAPYGNYYFGARHQFIVLKSELNNLGITGSKLITSLAFNNFAASGTSLSGLEIKIGHTTLAAYPTTGFSFQSGLSSVFTSSSYTDIVGWNTHTFQNAFLWDGNSNLIVEICFNNGAYTNNGRSYNSTASFRSSIWYYEDASGVCGKTASYSGTTRPNMRFSFINPSPPAASFISPDSVFVNVPFTCNNQSGSYTRSYWRISSVAPTLCATPIGCFNDTTNNQFQTTITQRGLYKITLVVKGYVGTYDSISRFVFADTTKRKPKANFSLSKTNAATLDVLNCLDSSLYGVYGWKWFLKPDCYGCAFNPFQTANYFMPSPNQKNPQLALFDGGIFDVCLVVWNDKGIDTLCRNSYLNVTQGYLMCSGTDSLTFKNSGYVFDAGGMQADYQPAFTGQCKSGFVINPQICSDSIIISIEQFRIRTIDTLEIRDGALSTSPLIKKLTGANLSAANRTFYARSGKAYMRLYTSSAVTNPPGDSGFVISWNTTKAARLLTNKNTYCVGDTALLLTNRKLGRSYTWLNNNVVMPAFNDTFCKVGSGTVYTLAISESGCTDSAKTELVFSPKVIAGFISNQTQKCLRGNSYLIVDTSYLSIPTPYTRKISFGDGSQTSDSIYIKKYTLPGNYTVRLSTLSDKGCRDSISENISVYANPASGIIYSGHPCTGDSAKLQSNITGSGLQYIWKNSAQTVVGNSAFIWAKSGSYMVTITDSNQCDSSSNLLSVIPKPLPQKPIVTLSSGKLFSTVANSYQWYLDNLLLQGATNRSLLPVQSGNYLVAIDSTNGCKNQSNAFNYIFNYVNDAPAKNLIEVYPNPVSGILMITATTPMHIELADLTSRVVYSDKNLNTSHSIDFSLLPAGTYFLMLYDSDGNIIRKKISRY